MNQPREVTAHRGAPDANQFLQVWAMPDRTNGHGVSAHYLLDAEEEAPFAVRTQPPLRIRQHIQFQVGAPCAVGMNGVTIEALLAIAADKLTQHQAGPLACNENAAAVRFIHFALFSLRARAQRRAHEDRASRQAAKEPRK